MRHQRPGRPPRPERREQHAREQVQEHRIRERDRHADLAPVEEVVRDAEPEQDQEIEVQQPERPPRVDEGREEEQAQREPYVRRVQLAPEGARVAARHRPRDLVAGPDLEDGPAAVVHLHLHDLVAATEEAHLPAPHTLRVGGRPQRPVTRGIVDLVRVSRDPLHLASAPLEEARRLGQRPRLLEVRRRRRGRQRGAQQERQRQRGYSRDSAMRKLHILFPRKFRGVAETIEIA